jgi:hypothetical protein
MVPFEINYHRACSLSKLKARTDHPQANPTKRENFATEPLCLSTTNGLNHQGL